MQLIEKYLESWNTADPALRRKLIDEVWAADGTYTDPLAEVTGPDQIDALVAGVRQQFGGLEFSLAGPVDAHHDLARFTWHLGPRGGEPVVVGFDVAVIADGRIRHVLGFLDKVPA
ncbi:nuclear transport factor 2 family protein [Plantactinospora siamensis]|uniref:Nuclear transport factor 2 family protein n=1 Tax=Plantactinospora siamensis TaxID=555372 RepID=A0ABV6NT42_9ACTN